jgi:hypothetical protein
VDGFGDLEGIVAGQEGYSFFDIRVVEDFWRDLIQGSRGAPWSGCREMSVFFIIIIVIIF